MTYDLNDPANPIKVENIDSTLYNPCPPFHVIGYSPNTQSPASEQANFVYSNIAYCIRFVQDRTNHKLTRWARTNNLTVMPRSGTGANAFYNGSTLQFMYFPMKDKRLCFTSMSQDIVIHELHHGLLDAWRGELWSSMSPEVMGAHEAFGDMGAILYSLAFPEIIEFILKETNNNIRNSNAVTKLAEQFGSALTGRDYLRNAVNDFKYQLPENLPKKASMDQLSSECHSYSRVLVGGFWNCICNQYEKNLIDHKNNHEALAITRDQIANILYNSVQIAQHCPRFYDAIARSMLVIDSNNGGNCKDSITQAFTERGILLPTPVTNFAIKMDGEEIKEFHHTKGKTLRVGGIKKLKLVDHMVLPQSDNPLYFVDVEIPCEHYVELNKKGKVKLEKPTILDEALHSAKICLDYLYENNKVSLTEDPDKQFQVIDNRLVRNSICS